MSIFNGKAEDIFNKKSDYPIGSICMFKANINPNKLYGGTWVRIEGKFILGADDSIYRLGSEGGEAKHKLTVAEMPSHEGHLYGNEAPNPPNGSDSYFLESNAATSNGILKKYNDRPYIIAQTNELIIKGFSRGGDQAHNNMPPYVALYIWTKVA